MKAFIAVTDNDWFDFLQRQEGIEEVNFWQPSGSNQFRALSPGEPLLFKLHAPLNFIAGGGYFWHFSLLPSRLAWEAFGTKNGTATYEDMRNRIAHYRREPEDPRAEYQIGCILLLDPFFLARDDWIPSPKDFHPNIVRGKGYDLAQSPGRELWEEVRNRRRQPTQVGEPSLFGDPVPVRPRLGQGTFRVLVTDNYDRRCAVTQEKTLPVLEAAHILPVSAGGQHDVRNGLLLRSDVHTLFDQGYVTVTADHRFEVSQRLKDDFQNGRVYYQLHGQQIHLPRNPVAHPNRELLRSHNEKVFLG